MHICPRLSVLKLPSNISENYLKVLQLRLFHRIIPPKTKPYYIDRPVSHAKFYLKVGTDSLDVSVYMNRITKENEESIKWVDHLRKYNR